MTGLTIEAAEALARDWCDAWNARDLERVLDHYADEIEIRSPLVVERFGAPDGVLKGKARLREYFGIGMRNAALRFTFERVLVGQSAMTVLYRRETGRLVSDTMLLDDELKAVSMTACYE